VYDLYGVLVHAGSPSGGHYYAFLRTSLDPQWFEFNDTSVTKVSEEVAVAGNFGGPVVRSSPTGREYSTSNRSDSAYVLIYVRREDAPRIFEPIPDSTVPAHLKEFLEHEDVEEETKQTAAPEGCEFLFYTERSIRLNAVNGKTGFSNEADKRTVILPRTATLADLYAEAISLFKKTPTEIRLWQIVQTAPRFIAPSEALVSSIYPRSFFIQKVPNHIKLSPAQGVTVYMEFLVPSAKSPVQYIGSTVVDRQNQLQTLFPLVNQIMGFPPKTALYVSDVSQSVVNLTTTLTFAQARIQDASILAFEVVYGRSVPRTTFRVRAGTIPSPPVYSGDLPLHTYATVFGSAGTALNLFKYFTSVIDQAHVILYPFDTPQIPICRLQFPTFITLQRLSTLIDRALQLQFDPQLDSLLLFKKDPAEDLPSRHWLHPQSCAVLKYALPPGPEFQKLYFRLEKGVPAPQLHGLRWCVARVSRDGIRLSAELVGRLLPATATVRDLVADAFAEDTVRVSSVYGSRLQEVIALDARVPDWANVRIDVVPDDQRSLDPERERIVPVAFAFADGDGHAKCTGEPFWFRVQKGETVGALRERLERALAVTAGEFAKYELMVGVEAALVRRALFLKADAVAWDEFEPVKETRGAALLLIDRTYRPPRAAGEVLKIRN
jgi:ubiquitin carboxyl-terminal hydrolase 7